MNARHFWLTPWPLWLGVRAGRFWLSVCHHASYRPLYSERNRIRSRALVVGPLRFVVKWSAA